MTAVGFKQPLGGATAGAAPEASAPSEVAERRRRQVAALVTRASYEFRRGEFERARMLGKYLRDVERSPEGIKILAIASHQLGDEDTAWAHYPAALEAFPGDLNVVVGFAELCLQRIELDKAHGLLRHALELDPEARHPAGAKARLLIMRADKQAAASR